MLTNIQEKPADLFYDTTEGVDFSSQNNFANFGSFAKVSVPVESMIQVSVPVESRFLATLKTLKFFFKLLPISLSNKTLYLILVTRAVTTTIYRWIEYIPD